jgi:hypothetical protein
MNTHHATMDDNAVFGNSNPKFLIVVASMVKLD